MSAQSRRELLLAIRPQYAQATWAEKKRLLDGFVAATGYSRKHAVTVLGKTASTTEHKRKRQKKYDEEVLAALIFAWNAANRICSKRLVPFLPELLQSLERFGHLSLPADVKKRLVSISAATADRILRHEKRKYGKSKSTTKPGHLIKKQIPVRTFADWNDVIPGFLEADLVAHCGGTVTGQFLHTLTMTDIATGWTELGALLRRSEADVLKSVSEIKNALPFPMLGFDTDNGGEFINYEVIEWCSQNKITFTRSREYRKNDQAHVEEKNGSVVRRLIGYDRYEGIESWELLSTLYRISRLYINFFQPCLKLKSKERDGARVRKCYEKALTPYERVQNAPSVSDESKSRLRKQFQELDPVLLLSEMERIQLEFWKTAILNGNGKHDTAKPPESATRDSPNRVSPPKAPQEYNLPSVDKRPAPPSQTRNKPSAKQRFGRPMAPGRKPGRKSLIEEFWNELSVELEKEPTLTARGLINILCQRYPGKFRPTQRSTIHQYLLEWRMSHLQLPPSTKSTESKSESTCPVEPSWQAISEKLRTKGVTRRILWHEYRQECKLSGTSAYSYAQYCRRYSCWLDQHNLNKTEPDWHHVRHMIEKKGVKRLTLWKEYRDQCEQRGIEGLSYNNYCRHYFTWLKKSSSS